MSPENGQGQNPEKKQHLRGVKWKTQRDIGREQGKTEPWTTE